MDSGTLTVTSLNFRKSGILVNRIGNLTVNGGTFTGGTSTFGGAIEVNAPGAGALSVTGATFTRNTAAYAGGAIDDYSYDDAYITDCTFTGNHSGGLGGAINANPDIATYLSDVVVRGNSATTGGGIFNATDIYISDSLISGNYAAGRGGGLYSSSNSGDGPPDAHVTGTVFRGNSAQQGAGIYSEGGLTSITASTIAGNTASGSGGGIYNNGDPRFGDGAVNLTNSTIARNRAGAYGGGIYDGQGQVAAASTTIARNTAAGGGGIYATGPFAAVTLTASPVLWNRPDNCEPASSITGCTS